MDGKECRASNDRIITEIVEEEKCDSENNLNGTNKSVNNIHFGTFLPSDVNSSSFNVCRGEQYATSESSVPQSNNTLVDLQHPQYCGPGINVATIESADSKNCDLDFGIISGRVNDDPLNSHNLTLKDFKKCPSSFATETPSCSTPKEDIGDGLNSSSCHSNVPSTSFGSKSTIRSAKSIEMQQYIDKLKEMVPYAKNAPKLSKVQLIHCAIDYITDLQEALEARVKRKKTNSQNSSTCRLPLSDLPVSQQLNSSNISDSLSPATIQFPRHPSTPDDLQMAIPHPLTFEPTIDSPVTVHQSTNQSVHHINTDRNVAPKMEESNSSPQNYSCVQSINQMFIRNVQEEKLKKFVLNKVGESAPERTKVEISPERESQVSDERRAYETVASMSHSNSDNTEGADKIRTLSSDAGKSLIQNNSSNSEVLLHNKRNFEEL